MKKSSLVIGTAIGALMMVASANAFAQSWADNTTVSGRMFYDFTDISNKVDGVKSNASGTSAIPATNGEGFDVKRFYIGVDHKFTDIFSANVTTDFQYNSTLGATELFVKKAYLAANFSPALTVTLGANDMPWIPYAESIYGNRYIEKTLVDRLSYGNSSDWGLHAAGTLNNVVSYDVAAVNGSGYKNPSRAESMDLEGRVSAKLDQFNFGIGGYTGKLGQQLPGVAVPQKASRLNALAAYSGDRLHIGVEYFQANDFSSALVKSTTPDKAQGYSYFASYRVTPAIMIFGRDDSAKLSQDITPAKKDDYYNLGVSYSAFKNVDFALVAKHDSLVPAVGHKTVGDEIGLFAQVRY